MANPLVNIQKKGLWAKWTPGEPCVNLTGTPGQVSPKNAHWCTKKCTKNVQKIPHMFNDFSSEPGPIWKGEGTQKASQMESQISFKCEKS